MPGDVQLTSLATKAAPLNYRVPGSAMIRVKSVRAEFTDNSASGDWLPAVKLISDSGHVIATASDQGAKVTAGDDAEASFFPGVKNAPPAAAASVTPVGFIPYDSAVLPAGDSYPNIVFITQTVPGVFVGSAGTNPFVIRRDGIYDFQLSANVENAHATDALIQFVFDVTDGPNFLSSVGEPLGFVVPATGSLNPASRNGSLSGVVRQAVPSNLCALRINCSQSLTVNFPYLVVTRTSTGTL